MEQSHIQHRTDPLVKDGRFIGSYLQWLKRELSGWDRLPWMIFGLGIGFQFALWLMKPITWLSTLTFIGIFFGFWCTVAMAAGGYNYAGERVATHSINGLLGAISVVAYIIVNFQAGHWWSILDQLCFFFLIDLELMVTWRTWGQGKNNVIKGLTKRGWIYVIATIIIAWIVLYYVGLVLKDTNPVWDSLELAIGATASWLCFRRYSTTFTLWLASDIINIILWFTTVNQGISDASVAMLAMTIMYFIIAIIGKFNWKPTIDSTTTPSTKDTTNN